MRTRLWADLAVVDAPATTPGSPKRPGRAWKRAAYAGVLALGAVAGALAVLGVADRTGDDAGAGWLDEATLALAGGAALACVGAAVAVRRAVVDPVRALEAVVAEVGVVPVGRHRQAAWPDPEGAGHGTLALLAGAVGALADEADVGRWSRAVVERSNDLTVVIDDDGLVVHASAAAQSMLGRPAAWLAGKALAAIVHPEDRGRFDDLRARVLDGDVRACEEVRFSHLHGHWVPTDATAIDVPDGRGGSARVLNVRDVSVRKALDDELMRKALYDPLTGLANRTLFREHVEKALARLRRTPARPHAVLFVDLDGFKMVNDSLGHAAGDEVLAEVGKRLGRWLRPGDTAARLGGDEFAVLLENTTQLDTGLLAARIIDVLDMPIHVQGKEVVLSGSIGIALSEPGLDSDSILRNADAAMYTAKAAGKGLYRVFEPEMHRAALRRLDLEADLRRAVGRRQLFLCYQPIVDLETGAVAATEVLVRWQHPQRGLIQPLDFISVAEDSGFIRQMGRMILEEACSQMRTWHRRYPEEPLQLCVNTSVRQIQHADFYDEVVETLRETGLDGRYLTLEITESLFMTDFPATVQKLRRLKGLGLTLAVDDFGTGYSSLSYLRSLPVDVLKIDKSFVHGVTLGPEQSAVARAVVKLARTFNLRTVAEGIERPDQAAELLALGADFGQGYWYARPLTANGMQDYLDARRPPRSHPMAAPVERLELPGA